MRSGILVAVPLIVGALLSGEVAAEERDTGWYQKQFEQWGAVIASLKEADRTQVMAQQIEHIRTLVGQAQAYLAAENTDKVDPVLVRIDTEVEFVRSKTGRIEAERIAELAKQEADKTEAEAQAIRAAAEEAARHRKDLEAKGL